MDCSGARGDACGSECHDAACKKVDREPRSGDFVVDIGTETAFVLYQIDEFESDQGLAGGQVVFAADDTECLATPESPARLDSHAYGSSSARRRTDE